MRALADIDLGQPFIAPDAVIGVDDEIANRQRLYFGQKCVGALTLLAPAHEAVTEHVLLGQDRDIGRGEAGVERQHRKRHGTVGGSAKRLLPALGCLRFLEPMIGHEAGEPLARTT